MNLSLHRSSIVFRAVRRFSDSFHDDQVRDKILSTSMKHVNQHGWSSESIALGVQENGLPTMSHTVIEKGPVELVEYFLNLKRKHVYDVITTYIDDQKNLKYAAEIEGENTPRFGNDCNAMDKDELIIRAVECHLNYIQPYLHNWSSALALLVDPNHLSLTTMKPAFEVVDDFCHFLDIRTSRMDWYTERAMLGFLYSSTEMYMLTDTSEGLADTK